MIWILWIWCVLCTGLAGYFYWRAQRLRRGIRTAMEMLEEGRRRLAMPVEVGTEDATADVGYAVAGKSTRKPWRQKRRELTLASRTQREHMEEIREAM